MPNTLTKIATITVASAGSAFSFDNIPQTYDNLLLKGSQRGVVNGLVDPIVIGFNNDTSLLYSNTSLGSINSAVAASRQSGNAYMSYNSYLAISAATSGANFFGHLDAYIPNYKGANNKSVILGTTAESNTSNATIAIGAGLYRSNNAITSLQLRGYNQNIDVNSVFTLYGIKNT
jgi:hypothetical protein